MKKAIIITSLFVIASGLTLKATAQEKNNSVNINRIYSSGISEHLKLRIDSTVSATIARFNIEKHSFVFIDKPSEGAYQIDLNFTQGKLVTKKQRTTAYLVNLIAPVYHPKHKISSTLVYPKHLSNGVPAKVNSSAYVLYANIRVKEDKLLKKYAGRLYSELQHLDEANSLSKR